MTATVQPVFGLVTLAERILDGVVPVPGGRAPRAAAVVARQALEEEVAARCAELATLVERPRMRSRLILLRHDDPEVGRIAQIAWDGLSAAVHHHSYELEPTSADVRSLLRLVATVVNSPSP